MKKDSIFSKEFWVRHWEGDQPGDTDNVHKGFSTVQYWDKAALSYNQDKAEVKNRRIEKTLSFLKEDGLLFKGMRVLDIGCGTGTLAVELARHGAKVTAIDFSKGMLDKFRQNISSDIKQNIFLQHDDWHVIDIKKKKWEKKFDLVIAFMSPGVSTPEAFYKMMACSKNGCAIRGWAQKPKNPILSDLWQKIMGVPLEDKPQSILYKINLLFSLGIFPNITFDTVKWDQIATVQDEFDRQTAFFEKLSDKSPEWLANIISKHLEILSKENKILREHRGLTATAIWKLSGEKKL